MRYIVMISNKWTEFPAAVFDELEDARKAAESIEKDMTEHGRPPTPDGVWYASVIQMPANQLVGTAWDVGVPETSVMN